MVRKPNISHQKRLNFDRDPPHLEIPLDEHWMIDAGTADCRPQFEDHREHQKRNARAGWPKTIFLTGCSVGLLVVAMWALTWI